MWKAEERRYLEHKLCMISLDFRQSQCTSSRTTEEEFRMGKQFQDVSSCTWLAQPRQV